MISSPLLRCKYYTKPGGLKDTAKNMKNIFDIVTRHGGLKAAISRGHKIHTNHIKERHSPDDCFPCTTVYELAKGFSFYLDSIG